MRRLGIVLAVAVMASASPAPAVKIMLPPVVTKCSRLTSWDAVDKCLDKHGLAPVAVVRDLPGAKLVQSQRGDRHGLYLYVERAGAWTLSGMYEPSGDDLAVLGLAPVTVGKHTGFRVDIGELVRTEIEPDGVTMVPALLRTETALFCGGNGWRCTAVMTKCDTLVRGGTLWTFHGTIAIENAKVRVTGDRRLVGEHCEVAEDHDLDWSDP